MVPSVGVVQGNIRYTVWDWLDAKFWHPPSVHLMCKSTQENASNADL
jgi:hypothetical protein